MSHRPHPTKAGWWQIIVSQGKKGKQLVFPIKGDEATAIVEDQRINAQIKGTRTTTYPTLVSALPTYLEYYPTVATPAIVSDFTSVMRRCILPIFGKYAVHHIIPTMVHSYTANRLKEKVTHRTIEKELNYLAAMCRWLHVNGLAERMPVIPKPPKAKCAPQKIQQPLTADELCRLLDCVPDDKRVLLLMMSDAGLRMTEALTLEWSSVDLAGLRVTIKGKGGKVVIYPMLTNRLIEAIRALHEKMAHKWLVVNEKTSLPLQSIKTLLRLATARAQIDKHVTHHTLRHTFSVLLMESGISTEVRQRLMRHSTLAATTHYTHISADYLNKQAAEFSAMINESESLKPK